MKKRYSHFTILMVFVAMCLGAAFLFFAYKVNNNLGKSIDDQINQTLQQSLMTVQIKLEERYSFLESVAISLGNNDSFQVQETRRLLDKQTKLHNSKRFFVISKDGVAYLDNGQVKDVHDNTSFQKAMQGQRTADGWHTSFVDGQNCMLFAVPIKSEKGIVGVLCAEYTEQQTKQLLPDKIFNEWGTVYIMDGSGNLIVEQGKYQYSNYYDFLSQTYMKNNMTVKRLKQELGDGNSGVFPFEYKGHMNYAGYASIGMNNWSIIISAPPAGIYQHSRYESTWWVMWIAQVALACIVVIYFIFRKQRKDKRELEKEKQELEILAGCIPGGILRYSIKEKGKIDYVSGGLLELFGYEEKEFLEVTDFFETLIYEPDREKVRDFVKNQGNGEFGDQLEYRIVDKSGKINWVYDSRKRITHKEDSDWFYALIMDITPQKRAKEETQISEERFRLIIEKTDNIVYEWDIEKDTVVFSSSWQRKLGHPLTEEHFLRDMDKRGLVHKDDVSKKITLLNHIKVGLISYGEVVIRLKNKRTNEFVWVKTCNMSIRSSQGVPVQMMGIAIDIDEQILETLKLKNQAEHDFLTGLYNRGTVETMINDVLSIKGNQKFHAFILIDVDNFKEINDTMGHMIGDQVLKDVSKKIKNSFRSDDIMGRLGGDEFVLFIKSIPSKEFLGKKLARICKSIETPLLIAGKNMKVTVSMGISLYSKDGDSYDELYKKADSALYSVKRNSKNNFSFYSPEMDSNLGK